MHFDQRVWISDSATVVCNQVWDTFSTSSNSLDAAQFVTSFNWSDSMEDESSLNIVEDTEEFFRSFNGDDICRLCDRREMVVSCTLTPY